MIFRSGSKQERRENLEAEMIRESRKALLGGDGGADGAAEPANLETKLELLTQKVDAMWEILKAATKLSDEALQKKIDAMHKPKPETESDKLNCPQCKQITAKDKPKCIYCGFLIAGKTN